MGEDDFLEAQYEDRYTVIDDEEPDAWVVVDLMGTMIRGPFGTEEAAEQALDGMLRVPGIVVAPVYY